LRHASIPLSPTPVRPAAFGSLFPVGRIVQWFKPIAALQCLQQLRVTFQFHQSFNDFSLFFLRDFVVQVNGDKRHRITFSDHPQVARFDAAASFQHSHGVTRNRRDRWRRQIAVQQIERRIAINKMFFRIGNFNTGLL
jgi:hypothetical protein